jgi:amphiphysin
MQLNVFYTLHDKMQGMNIAYFNLKLDVEEAFEQKRGDVQERAEALMIVHFKTKGLGRSGSKVSSLKAAEAKAGRGRSSSTADENPPPPYSSAATPSPTGSNFSAAAKSKPAPPPPRAKPAHLSKPVERVTALYDYEAQAHGALGFSAGDVIEITQRTDNTNEWWSGKIDGREGQFPGECEV